MYHSGNRLVDPKILFEKTQIRPGMHVADFGCGRNGHIMFPLALQIGDSGLVYAVDILKDVLQNVEKRAKLEALTHVHTIWSDLERVGMVAIPAGSLDVVFIVNMLYQSKARDQVLTEAARVLKEKGRILVIDWTNKDVSFAPPRDVLVDFSAVKSWARIQGFGIQEEFAAGPYHHAVVLYRNG